MFRVIEKRRDPLTKMETVFNPVRKLGRVSVAVLCALLCILNVSLSYAEAPKVFTARFNDDMILERLYESEEVELTITETPEGDKFLEQATVKGMASIDAVNGRMMIELKEIVQAGMPMAVVGYVLDEDKKRGVDACEQWQTRMFEDAKLCYIAEVYEDREIQLVVSIDGYTSAPVVVQADNEESTQ